MSRMAEQYVYQNLESILILGLQSLVTRGRHGLESLRIYVLCGS